MFPIVFSICISIFPILISATDICTNKSPCKCVLSAGQVIDITSVGLIGFPSFYQIKSGKNERDNHLYSYNPCYSFSSLDSQHTVAKDGNKPCLNAAACMRSPGGNNGDLPEEYAIGLQSEAVFGSHATDQYHINYTVPGTNQKLIVTLKCDESAVQHLLTVESEPGDQIKNMTLTSKCACKNLCTSRDPEPPHEGMSTGSKLLIVFFTFFLVYFIIGFGWNFCNGAHGLELIPNFEFWNELPKLIVEGVAFACSCFGRRTAYGEV